MHSGFHVSTQSDLGPIRGLKIQLDRFNKVLPGLFDGVALAGDVQFRAEGDEPFAFTLQHARELAGLLHVQV